MDATGVYLYCFTRAGAARKIAAAGVDERSVVTALEGSAAAAVFSTVAIHEFTGDAAAPGEQDPQQLVLRVCRHEQVIEEVMREAPVLPVRFGTVFSSGQLLEKFLAGKEQEVARILDRISDKEEWAVKGFLDGARATEWLMASDPVLAESRRQLPAAAGARYLRQKRLDAQAEEALRLWCRELLDQVQSRLEPHAVDASAIRLQPGNVTGRTDEMVLNVAYLMLKSSLAAFRKEVESLGNAYAQQGLTLELTGPWPPYNFCPPLREGQDEALGVRRDT